MEDPEQIGKLLERFQPLVGRAHICLLGAGEAFLLGRQQKSDTNAGAAQKRKGSLDSSGARHARATSTAKAARDDYSHVNTVALFFMKRGFPYISVVRGGFAGAHEALTDPSSPADLSSLVDHNIQECRYCGYVPAPVGKLPTLLRRLSAGDPKATPVPLPVPPPQQPDAFKLAASGMFQNFQKKMMFKATFPTDSDSPMAASASTTVASSPAPAGNADAPSTRPPPVPRQGSFAFSEGLKLPDNFPFRRTSVDGSASSKLSTPARSGAASSAVGSPRGSGKPPVATAAATTAAANPMFGFFSRVRKGAAPAAVPSGSSAQPAAAAAAAAPALSSSSSSAQQAAAVAATAAAAAAASPPKSASPPPAKNPSPRRSDSAGVFVISDGESESEYDSSSDAGSEAGGSALRDAPGGVDKGFDLPLLEHQLAGTTKGAQIDLSLYRHVRGAHVFTSMKRKHAATDVNSGSHSASSILSSESATEGSAEYVPRSLFLTRERILVLELAEEPSAPALVKSNHHLTELAKVTFLRKDPSVITLHYRRMAGTDATSNSPATSTAAVSDATDSSTLRKNVYRLEGVEHKERFVGVLQESLKRFSG
eukprot:TRINITY_DN1872_c0_g1_i1.p1 TRINITY_DN1872_c0_g1~~TRINITY_DN1872_c0_g1_i1.p1  ORF type:complete len:698 (-),score=207.35 TRINITY_DN1872_c0_g1_i1:272-2059(-)